MEPELKPDHFGDKLRRFRLSREMTEDKLAYLSFVSRHAIIRYELGIRIPDPLTMSRLTHALDLSPRESNALTKAYLADALWLDADTSVLDEDESLASSIVTRFHFPPSVKVACQQYLLYFVEFLRDVGVEATSAIREEAGDVLFTVTPLDKKEGALENIRQALEIYLQVPAVTDPSLSVVYDASAEELKLAGQVEHLRSQLHYAALQMRAQQETLQAREEIIRSKDEVIYTQRVALETLREIADGTILVESITGSVKQVLEHNEGKDEEAVLGEVVKLGEFEHLGIKLSLAEVYRKVKRLFQDEGQDTSGPKRLTDLNK